MRRGTLLFEPGTLWARVMRRTRHALRCGALQSLPTQSEFVEQQGVRFVVRLLAALARKDEAKPRHSRTADADISPFLPYERDLFVADISDTHVCLLNKFNVVDHHLLIVTRAFEEQESLLNSRDFEALWTCMAEFDGLAFYNAGRVAGASQRHKHLQIVPLPLVAEGPPVPVEPVLPPPGAEGRIGTASRLPFVHALVMLDPRVMRSPSRAAAACLEYYQAMLGAVCGRGAAYNLLATRRWILLVPRSQECHAAISVNALGFAGALLVRNEEQMRTVKAQGPMTVLRHVAFHDTMS